MSKNTNIKADDKLAIKAVPSVLDSVMDDSVTKSERKRVSRAITDSMEMFGYKNKELIISSVKELAPIATKFFDRLYSVVELSSRTNYEKFNKIVEVIVNADDKDLPIERKIELINERIEADRKSKEKIVKGVTVATVIAVSLASKNIVNGVVEVIKDNHATEAMNNLIEQEAMNTRMKLAAKTNIKMKKIDAFKDITGSLIETGGSIITSRI